jgi:hypothetical protein
VELAGQKYPAAQGPLQADEVSSGSTPYTPAGQGAAIPAAQYCPGWHGAWVAWFRVLTPAPGSVKKPGVTSVGISAPCKQQKQQKHGTSLSCWAELLQRSRGVEAVCAPP